MQPLERRAWLLTACAVALIAAFWRFETLAQRPLWLDERYTARVVQKSGDLAALWREAAADQNLHPPLAYAPAWLAAHGAESRQSLRMPAAIAGLASIALLAALATRLFGRWTGLLAAFLMGISIYHVDFSQEARPYMIALTFTLGASPPCSATSRRGARCSSSASRSLRSVPSTPSTWRSPTSPSRARSRSPTR